MGKDKKEEEKKEKTESELSDFVVRPLEYCEPMSLSEFMKDEEKEKEEAYYS
ncbi:MAG: hypothetical protein ACI4WM_09245 [Erysipelotrichaceae bacterium]